MLVHAKKKIHWFEINQNIQLDYTFLKPSLAPKIVHYYYYYYFGQVSLWRMERISVLFASI